MTTITNTVNLTGNLGADVEVRESNDTTYAHFSVATNYSVRKEDGTYEKRTSWVRVTAFGGQARSMAALGKGSLVQVLAHLRQSVVEVADKKIVTHDVDRRRGGVPAGEAARWRRCRSPAGRRRGLRGGRRGGLTPSCRGRPSRGRSRLSFSPRPPVSSTPRRVTACPVLPPPAQSEVPGASRDLPSAPLSSSAWQRRLAPNRGEGGDGRPVGIPLRSLTRGPVWGGAASPTLRLAGRVSSPRLRSGGPPTPPVSWCRPRSRPHPGGSQALEGVRGGRAPAGVRVGVLGREVLASRGRRVRTPWSG